MRPLDSVRRSAAVLLGCLLLAPACSLGTESEPAIPMVTVPGTFVSVVSGAVERTTSGAANTDSLSAGGGRRVELRDATVPELRISFQRGTLTTGGTFDFAVGNYSLTGIPGFRELDATLTLGQPIVDVSVVARTGTLQIEAVSATMIRGRFDITGVITEAGMSREVRARGTFWSVPAP